jgi:hypothetical protein
VDLRGVDLNGAPATTNWQHRLAATSSAPSWGSKRAMSASAPSSPAVRARLGPIPLCTARVISRAFDLAEADGDPRKVAVEQGGPAGRKRDAERPPRGRG